MKQLMQRESERRSREGSNKDTSNQECSNIVLGGATHLSPKRSDKAALNQSTEMRNSTEKKKKQGLQNVEL